jgi:TolB protein
MRSISARPALLVVVTLIVAACGSTSTNSTLTPSPTTGSSVAAGASAVAGSPSVRPSPSVSSGVSVDGQIVFEDAGDNFVHSQVWIENADGSNVRQLVTSEFTDGSAALSPDGRTVAFDRIKSFSIDELLADPTLLDKIMFVNVDGSGLHEVVVNGFGLPDLCIDGIEGNAFAPDGRRIVFTRLCVNTGRSGLWTSKLDGTDPREVTRNVASPEHVMRFLKDGTGFVHLEDHRASWSPDGKHLVFQRIDTSTTPERAAIFTIGIEGKGLHQVTPWKLDANDPVWSPDGTLIAFNSPAEGSHDQNIWTIHPDGTGPLQLTKNDEEGQATFHPSWSPDGSQILFSHSPSTGGWGDFFVMNRDGSDLHLLAATAIHENHAYWGASPKP